MTKTFDPTKPVQTRDGRSVRILCTDVQGTTSYPIVALVTNEGEEAIEHYTSDGRYLASETRERSDDLVNMRETVTRYISSSYSYTHAAYARREGYTTFKIVTDKETGAVLSAETVAA